MIPLLHIATGLILFLAVSMSIDWFNSGYGLHPALAIFCIIAVVIINIMGCYLCSRDNHSDQE